MNQISGILDKIKSDAEALILQGQEANNKAIEDIKKLYEKEAEIETSEILSKAQKEIEAIEQRSVSQGAMDSRNKKLQTKREAVDFAFQQALTKLCNLPNDKKSKLYLKLMGEYITADDVVITFNKKDKEELGEKLVDKAIKMGISSQISLSSQTGDFAGGLIIRQGNIETNCTFEVFIMDMKQQIEGKVASILFE